MNSNDTTRDLPNRLGLDPGIQRKELPRTAGETNIDGPHYFGDHGWCAGQSLRCARGLVVGGFVGADGSSRFRYGGRRSDFQQYPQVRMQADSVLPPAQRRNYTGVFNALSSIVKVSLSARAVQFCRTSPFSISIFPIIQAEGVLGLWKGANPTVIRAMALNVGQLAGNSEALARLQAYLGTDTPGKRQTATFGAAFVAAFLASFMSLPFDFIKTRLQKQVADPVTGKVKYNGGLCEGRVEDLLFVLF